MHPSKYPFWLATLFVPVVLVLAAVRLMMTPLYIQVEYRMPGFPPDPYGFTFEERLHWADISRQYLLNREGIEFLANQRLDASTPLFNERELRHMLDVKIVMRGALVVLYLAGLYLLALGFWSRRSGKWGEYKEALSWGGWLSVGLIAAILAYLALNFNSLFINFHKVFFEGDTWMFKYSDTLIRLFPLRFWRDAFLWIGAVTALCGFLLGYCLSPSRPRR